MKRIVAVPFRLNERRFIAHLRYDSLSQTIKAITAVGLMAEVEYQVFDAANTVGYRVYAARRRVTLERS